MNELMPNECPFCGAVVVAKIEGQYYPHYQFIDFKCGTRWQADTGFSRHCAALEGKQGEAVETPNGEDEYNKVNAMCSDALAAVDDAMVAARRQIMRLTLKNDELRRRLSVPEKRQSNPNGIDELLVDVRIDELKKQLSELKAKNIELQCRLDAKPSKLAQVEKAFLRAALTEVDGTVRTYEKAAYVLNWFAIHGCKTLERMAAVLEQATKDEAMK